MHRRRRISNAASSSAGATNKANASSGSMAMRRPEWQEGKTGAGAAEHGRGAARYRLTGQRELDGTQQFTMPADQHLPGFAVKHLLTEGRAFNTVLLWITFFCNLLVIYYLASWLPLVLRDSGVPLDDALRLGGIVPWAGIVSTLVLGPVVDRLGPTRVVTVLYVLAAAFVFAIGLSGASIALLSITIIGAGMWPGDQNMRIFKRGDKPATVTESASVLGDSFFDRLLRQQQSRKSDLRNPLTGDPFDPRERYNPHEVKMR